MSVAVQCSDFPLDSDEVSKLWQHTIASRAFPDEAVAIRCVGKEEIRRLNREYRRKDEPTNVLTFSYSSSGDSQEKWPEGGDGVAEHDVVLCLKIAEHEARLNTASALSPVNLRDHVAWLLVHAFLHITGLDHEQSQGEALETKAAEAKILSAAGFRSSTMSSELNGLQ